MLSSHSPRAAELYGASKELGVSVFAFRGYISSLQRYGMEISISNVEEHPDWVPVRQVEQLHVTIVSRHDSPTALEDFVQLQTFLFNSIDFSFLDIYNRTAKIYSSVMNSPNVAEPLKQFGSQLLMEFWNFCMINVCNEHSAIPIQLPWTKSHVLVGLRILIGDQDLISTRIFENLYLMMFYLVQKEAMRFMDNCSVLELSPFSFSVREEAMWGVCLCFGIGPTKIAGHEIQLLKHFKNCLE